MFLQISTILAQLFQGFSTLLFIKIEITVKAKIFVFSPLKANRKLTMRKILISAAFFIAATTMGLKAQTAATPAPTQTAVEGKAPDNWFNLDPEQDGVPGMSTERAYKELLADKTSVTVIVAVIDSGVDPEHEDLKAIMWTNPGEIPGNGIDDDKNGYVDDIHGWNFIGGKDGKNVNQDTYEMVRLIKKFKPQFDGKSESDIAPADKANYARYINAKKEYDQKRTSAMANYSFIKPVFETAEADIALVKKEFGLETLTPDNIATLKSDKKDVRSALNTVKLMSSFGSANDTEFMETLKEYNEYFSDMVEYSLNMDFDPRPIVGDNYNDSSERYYGNNDVRGADASHGTHVAGIIGAIRNNGIGINGVANNVRIMSVRVVPNGDERDKDVANGIRYAADNGAKIINMSFGKYYPGEKKVVDDAVKYAQSKGVLLIQAAGNEGMNLDAPTSTNFPDREYEGGGKAANWIVVGASSWKNDAEGVADFSNYGKKAVDVFSPGVDIYSSIPDSKYKSNSGTSMASPATAGVAALLMSYFPDLSPAQIKEIILKSVKKQGKRKVNKPGTGGRDSAPTQTTLGGLCNTGGIVNAYEAIKIALKTKPKKEKAPKK